MITTTRFSQLHWLLSVIRSYRSQSEQSVFTTGRLYFIVGLRWLSLWGHKVHNAESYGAATQRPWLVSYHRGIIIYDDSLLFTFSQCIETQLPRASSRYDIDLPYTLGYRHNCFRSTYSTYVSSSCHCLCVCMCSFLNLVLRLEVGVHFLGRRPPSSRIFLCGHRSPQFRVKVALLWIRET